MGLFVAIVFLFLLLPSTSVLAFERLNEKKVNVANRVSLVNHMDNIYYCELKVGTPGQRFKVAIDTGSSDLWVTSIGWPTTAYPHPRFDSRRSTSFRTDGTKVRIKYETGSLTGTLSVETVEIGGIKITRQSFVQGTNTSENDPFIQAPFDGILGLGSQLISTKHTVPVWDTMLKQGRVTKKLFSIWLRRYSKSGRNGGEIIFGGSDPAHFTGEHIYVPVRGDRNHFFMNSISVRGTMICSEIDCKAFVDSGSSDFTGPELFIMAINGKIGAKTNCANFDSLPDVTFTILGKPFVVTRFDYIERPKRNQCRSRFVPDTHYNDHWVLGQPFMREYHTIFDYQSSQLRIGLAKSIS